MAEYPEYIKNSYKSTRKKPNNPRENNELSTEYAINIQGKKKNNGNGLASHQKMLNFLHNKLNRN